ncbi:unnamed protein product [Sphacelaria rigidula]
MCVYIYTSRTGPGAALRSLPSFSRVSVFLPCQALVILDPLSKYSCPPETLQDHRDRASVRTVANAYVPPRKLKYESANRTPSIGIGPNTHLPGLVRRNLPTKIRIEPRGRLVTKYARRSCVRNILFIYSGGHGLREGCGRSRKPLLNRIYGLLTVFEGPLVPWCRIKELKEHFISFIQKFCALRDPHPARSPLLKKSTYSAFSKLSPHHLNKAANPTHARHTHITSRKQTTKQGKKT